MHPNSLKNLKLFQPGQSGNAGRGRNRLPDELKGIESLTQTEVVKLISKFARMSYSELLSYDVKQNPDINTPVLELAVASIFSKSIRLGDYTRLSFLLDRCVGKVPVTIDDDESKSEREQLAKLSLNELIALIQSNLPDTPEAV